MSESEHNGGGMIEDSTFDDPRTAAPKKGSKLIRFVIPGIVLTLIAAGAGNYFYDKGQEITEEEAIANWAEGIPEPTQTAPVSSTIAAENVFTHNCDRLVYKPSQLQDTCEDWEPTFLENIKWEKWEPTGAFATATLSAPDDKMSDNPKYSTSEVHIKLSEPVNIDGLVFFKTLKYYILDKSGNETDGWGMWGPSMIYGMHL
jgi:hypothetical protein